MEFQENVPLKFEGGIQPMSTKELVARILLMFGLMLGFGALVLFYQITTGQLQFILSQRWYSAMHPASWMIGAIAALVGGLVFSHFELPGSPPGGGIVAGVVMLFVTQVFLLHGYPMIGSLFYGETTSVTFQVYRPSSLGGAKGCSRSLTVPTGLICDFPKHLLDEMKGYATVRITGKGTEKGVWVEHISVD